MKKLVFAFAVVAAGCLASCGNGSTSSTETTTPETTSTEAAAPVENNAEADSTTVEAAPADSTAATETAE